MAPVKRNLPKILRLPLSCGAVCVLAVIALALFAVACGGGNSKAPAGTQETPEVNTGAPRRIVSLSPGHTEILFAIGAGDQVIGVDTQADYPPEVGSKTRFDAANPDVTALAQLKPDLVVTIAGAAGGEQILTNAGFPLIVLNVPPSFNELFGQIDQLGAATGHVNESDSLVVQLDNRVTAVQQKVRSEPRPRVYHEVNPDLTTASSVTFPGELYLILNASAIGSDSPQPYPQLTTQQIVEADPEVIVLAYPGASPESVKSRPGWAEISAVRNNRVFALDPAMSGRPGPRLVDGLETLAELLYPSLFAEAR